MQLNKELAVVLVDGCRQFGQRFDVAILCHRQLMRFSYAVLIIDARDPWNDNACAAACTRLIVCDAVPAVPSGFASPIATGAITRRFLVSKFPIFPLLLKC